MSDNEFAKESLERLQTIAELEQELAAANVRIAELGHLEKQQLQDEKDSLTLALSKAVQRIAELDAAAREIFDAMSDMRDCVKFPAIDKLQRLVEGNDA